MRWCRLALMAGGIIEWVRPHAGARCSLRLPVEHCDAAALARFWDLLTRHEIPLVCGSCFGETDRAFRLGFGYLPPERLQPALSALSATLDATSA